MLLAGMPTTRRCACTQGRLVYLVSLALNAGQDEEFDALLTHDHIWSAIDRLAKNRGLTASSLARLAGLDPTTFNRSKRLSADGNARWPSTESIAKILAATNVTVDEFLALIPKERAADASVIPFRQVDGRLADAFGAHGQPTGMGWENLPLPVAGDESAFALGIVGDRHAPTYRDGDILLLSTQLAPRHGDRILLMDQAGLVTLAVLGQKTAGSIHLRGLDGGTLPVCAKSSIRLLARILWASQ